MTRDEKINTLCKMTSAILKEYAGSFLPVIVNGRRGFYLIAPGLVFCSCHNPYMMGLEKGDDVEFCLNDMLSADFEHYMLTIYNVALNRNGWGGKTPDESTYEFIAAMTEEMNEYFPEKLVPMVLTWVRIYKSI